MIWNRQRAVRVARQPLEEFLRRVEKGLHLAGSDVTVCLVSDAEMTRLNEAFRKKKGPTDVLSFPADKKRRKRIHTETPEKHRRKSVPGTTESYLGDIAIAPETARRYAKKNGRSLGDELRVLMLHGVLHLLGYDHEADRGEMNHIEQKMRRRFGLA
jgi:probable rRNA maturation factor